MTVIQIGKAKSGNSWVYKIIRSILETKDDFQTPYIVEQPIYDEAKKWPLSLDWQAEVDVLDITDHGYYYRISSRFREKVEDIDHYLKNTSHIWTHSRYCDKTDDLFSKIGKKVYVCRDPRDVLISRAHFTQSDYMEKYYPNVKRYLSAQDYINKMYEWQFFSWAYHVFPYLVNTDVYVIFFERLKQETFEEIKNLSEYLGYKLSEDEIKRVKEMTSYKKMKQSNPDHVRKGKKGNWRQVLSKKQIEYAKKNIGALLNMLNYPLDTEEKKLPRLTDNINKKVVKEELKKVKKNYYVEASIGRINKILNFFKNKILYP